MSQEPKWNQWADLQGAGLPNAMSAALDARHLCDRARHLARLDDFGDPGFLAGLARLCAAFAQAGLTPIGHLLVGARMTRALMTRLRLIEARRRVPERFAEPLNEPIVIVGPARSGSTFLHHLWCALPNVRFLPYWETREPIADPEDDDRRARAQHIVELVTEGVPGLARKHPLDVDAPDECMYLLDASFSSPSFHTDAPIPSYLAWLVDQDAVESYRIYRQLLQYIQTSAPGDRLALKSPAHLSRLDALSAAVPEAKIVQLHRDPVAVLPSTCGLLETLHGMTTAVVDRRALGRRQLDLLDHQFRRNAEQRPSLEPRVLFDLDFRELTKDPVGSVSRIHDHFGWSLPREAPALLSAFVASRTAEHIARDRYQLADFGLDAAEVTERFRDYRERWGFA